MAPTALLWPRLDHREHLHVHLHHVASAKHWRSTFFTRSSSTACSRLYISRCCTCCSATGSFPARNMTRPRRHSTPGQALVYLVCLAVSPHARTQLDTLTSWRGRRSPNWWRAGSAPMHQQHHTTGSHPSQPCTTWSSTKWASSTRRVQKCSRWASITWAVRSTSAPRHCGGRQGRGGTL